MTPQQRAIEIMRRRRWLFIDDGEEMISEIASEIQSAIEEALAQRDLEQFGEAFMLNGKRIDPNGIYKSTDDDLFFWKNLCGNREVDQENLEIHPNTLGDLINRLEAAERVLNHQVDNEAWWQDFELWKTVSGKYK